MGKLQYWLSNNALMYIYLIIDRRAWLRIERPIACACSLYSCTCTIAHISLHLQIPNFSRACLSFMNSPHRLLLYLSSLLSVPFTPVDRSIDHIQTINSRIAKCMQCAISEPIEVDRWGVVTHWLFNGMLLHTCPPEAHNTSSVFVLNCHMSPSLVVFSSCQFYVRKRILISFSSNFNAPR